MKLSDIKGEKALEVLADLLGPAREIFKDTEVLKILKEDKLECVSYVLKNHTKNVLTILALTEGVPVEEYKETCNVMSLPNKLLEIFTDTDLMGFLYSQVPEEAMTFFGRATESTEEPATTDSSSDTLPAGTSENSKN